MKLASLCQKIKSYEEKEKICVVAFHVQSTEIDDAMKCMLV